MSNDNVFAFKTVRAGQELDESRPWNMRRVCDELEIIQSIAGLLDPDAKNFTSAFFRHTVKELRLRIDRLHAVADKISSAEPTGEAK